MKCPLALVAIGMLVVACKDKPPPPMAPAPAPTNLAPPDQLLPGELAEGTTDAFGFKLPRFAKVNTRFADATFATVEAQAKDVVNYVRSRVVAERVDTSAGKTVFEGATLKIAPQHKLRIEVITQSATHSKLVVRDETRPPAKPGLTEEERWREVGMTPHGEVLDPTRLQ
jgi:hypothetical protein